MVSSAVWGHIDRRPQYTSSYGMHVCVAALSDCVDIAVLKTLRLLSRCLKCYLFKSKTHLKESTEKTFLCVTKPGRGLGGDPHHNALHDGYVSH